MLRYCGHYYCFSTSILIFEVLKWSAVSKFSLVAVGKVHLYLRGVCWLKSCWCAGFLSASSNFPYLRVWLISSCLHLDVCHSSLDLTAYANAKKKNILSFFGYIYIYIFLVLSTGFWLSFCVSDFFPALFEDWTVSFKKSVVVNLLWTLRTWCFFFFGKKLLKHVSLTCCTL